MLRAYLCLIAAMTIVGSSVVAGKIIIAHVPVLLASGIRFGLASLVLIPITLLQKNGMADLARLTRKDWLALLVLAFCGQFIFSLFLLLGLKLTSATNAGIITSSTPAVVALIALVFLKERLGPRAGLGISLAVAGLLAINTLVPDSSSTGDRPLLGNMLIFFAVLGEATFSVMRKFISEGVSALTISTILSVLGFGMFLPLAVWQGIGFEFSALSLEGWFGLAYFGLVVTVLAYLFWFAGAARVPASTAGVFTAVMPISAVLLSALVLGEKLSPAHLVGGGCVLAGILLVTLMPAGLGSPKQNR